MCVEQNWLSFGKIQFSSPLLNIFFYLHKQEIVHEPG